MMEVGLRGRARIERTRVVERRTGSTVTGSRGGIGIGIGIGRGIDIGDGSVRAGSSAGGARVVQDPLPAQPLVVVVGRAVHHGRVIHRVHDAGRGRPSTQTGRRWGRTTIMAPFGGCVVGGGIRSGGRAPQEREGEGREGETESVVMMEQRV